MTDDSDETEGRKLYRAHADALARAQVSMGKRRIKLIIEVNPFQNEPPYADPGRLVPHHGSGPAEVHAPCFFPDESILEDDYPIFADYYYLADGKLYRSDWHDITAAELKRLKGFKEVRRCNWRRYNGTK
jgi:hypothetical protein